MITLFDIKNTLDRLAKDKKYCLTILFSMSLGLAVFLFLFSQIHVRNYSILPFSDGERIVFGSRFENDLARLDGGLSDYEIHAIMKRNSVLDDLAAFEHRGLTLSTTSFTEQIRGVATSSNFFKLADVRPILGRVFQASDDERSAPPRCSNKLRYLGTAISKAKWHYWRSNQCGRNSHRSCRGDAKRIQIPYQP